LLIWINSYQISLGLLNC